MAANKRLRFEKRNSNTIFLEQPAGRYVFIFNVASLRKSERLIFSRGHGCFTISPRQLPAAATRFPPMTLVDPG